MLLLHCGLETPQGHMKPSATVDFGWFVAFELKKFSVLKLFEIVILWVYYTIPFSFSLFKALLRHHLSSFKISLFG